MVRATWTLVADVRRRDCPHPAATVVIEGLRQLLVGVHHEGAVPGDRLANRLTAEARDIEMRRTAFLREVGRKADHVACAERRQLSGADGRTRCPHGSPAVEDVD